MDEERLVNIETKLTFQEDLIEELNKTVYQQQQKLDQLEEVCRMLARQVASLTEAGNEGQPANERSEVSRNGHPFNTTRTPC
jgi:SlyX protein